MDKLFGLSEQGLKLTEDRAVMITNNLANSSTPNYKAKDIDFTKIMQDVNRHSSQLDKTSTRHLSGLNTVDGVQTMYRIPMQASMDGNTVDPEIERKNFLQNSIRYQVSLTFIQNRTEEIMKAIKGE